MNSAYDQSGEGMTYKALLEELARVDDSRWRRLAVAIRDIWGTEEGYNFLLTILLDTRDGGRKGFPDAVCKILTQLSIEHSNFYDPPEPEFAESDFMSRWNGA